MLQLRFIAFGATLMVAGSLVACGAAEDGAEPATRLTVSMTIYGAEGVPSGTLGAVPFSGSSGAANLSFVFTGRLSDVVPYYVPTELPSLGDGRGYEIVVGEASVRVEDAVSRATLAQGAFTPEAGIFVSVDNGNRGVGFGSRGSLPGGETWPNKGMEVAYPYALFRMPAEIDLSSSFSTTEPLPAAACPGFNLSPGPPDPNGSNCHAAFGLPTSVGDFYLDVDGLISPVVTGSFRVEVE